MSLRRQLRLRTRVQEASRRVGWHVVPANRFDIARRGYYSGLPDLDSIPSAVWDRESPMTGITFDLEAQFRWAEAKLLPFADEFRPPDHGDPARPEFFLFNHSYQAGDANVLYAMIRHLKPHRVLELGSGFSTLVIAQAMARNQSDGHTGHFTAFNPYPPENIAGHQLSGLSAHHAVAAQDIPAETFRELRAGDVLFVDTTHTVKIGSEVNRIVLDILPTLASGVCVHFHDISLPYEYPRWLLERMGSWAEQYLLQAFLVCNSRFSVLLGIQALSRADPDRLRRIAPDFFPAGHYPSAFWLVAE